MNKKAYSNYNKMQDIKDGWEEFIDSKPVVILKIISLSMLLLTPILSLLYAFVQFELFGWSHMNHELSYVFNIGIDLAGLKPTGHPILITVLWFISVRHGLRIFKSLGCFFDILRRYLLNLDTLTARVVNMQYTVIEILDSVIFSIVITYMAFQPYFFKGMVYYYVIKFILWLVVSFFKKSGYVEVPTVLATFVNSNGDVVGKIYKGNF